MPACFCVFVYIKQPLMAIGGGGGPTGVFALAAFQHSTFLCDIQYCDLRKPALQRSSLSLSFSVQHLSIFLSCHLFTFLCFTFCPLISPLIIYSAPFSFFSIWTWKIICQSPPSLLKNFLSVQVLADNSLLSLRIHNPSQYPSHSMCNYNAHFSFIRNFFSKNPECIISPFLSLFSYSRDFCFCLKNYHVYKLKNTKIHKHLMRLLC